MIEKDTNRACKMHCFIRPHFILSDHSKAVFQVIFVGSTLGTITAIMFNLNMPIEIKINSLRNVL